MHRRLERLYTRFEQNPNDEDKIDIDLIKENINEILQIRLNGSIIRSRQNWHEHGGKSSKFFLNLEKRNFNNKTVKCLKLDDGKIITQRDTILSELHKFYSELYTSHHEMPIDFSELYNLELPKLTEIEQRYCEGILTESEILSVLKPAKTTRVLVWMASPLNFTNFSGQILSNI